MSLRVKGQEVEVMLILDGIVKDAVTTIKSFEVTAQLETLTEGYLGEPTDRRDDVFRGVKGSMELHFEDKAVFDVMRAIVDRAKRKIPGAKVNVKATLNMPNGQRPKILIEDAYFGEIPLTFGGRTEYGTVKLNFEAADFAVL